MGYKALILTALAAALTTASCVKADLDAHPSAGDALPEFGMTLGDGTEVTAEELKEADVTLVFYSTGCPDCREELPEVEEFHRRHPDRGVFAISRNEDAATTEAYWRAAGLTLPYCAEGGSRIYDMFTGGGIPYIVVSRGGTLTATFTERDRPTAETLEEATR